MIIAVLADIHSNLQALQAVLADARAQGAQQFIVAGDHVIDGPSVEVLDRVMELTPLVIRGNREEYLLERRAGSIPSWEGFHQMASTQWSYERMEPRYWHFIESLPAQTTLQIEGVCLRVVHGSPWKTRGRLVPGENNGDIGRASREVAEDVLIHAHTHLPGMLRTGGKLFVNPGSVGVAFDVPGYTASYALMHIAGGTVQPVQRCVPFDAEAFWQEVRSSGLMDAAPHWTMLTFMSVRDGREYCMPFLQDAAEERRRRGLSDEGFFSNEIWEAVWKRWVERLPQLRF